DDGNFAFSGLPAGPVEVRAAVTRSGIFDGTGARTSVAAGTRDVVLVVSRGADLVVRVENWAESKGERHPRAVLFPDGERRARHAKQFDANVADDGVVRFRGLDAVASYTLWIEPDSDGRSVYVTGIRAAGTEV